MRLVRLRDIVVFSYQVILGKIISLFPFEVVYRVVVPIAYVVCLLKGFDKQYFERLQILIPGIRREISREFCTLRAIRFLEEIKSSSLVQGRNIRNVFKVEGLENLDKALEMGKGVVLVSAHFGGSFSAYLLLHSLGYRIHMVRAVTDKDVGVSSRFLHNRILRFRMGIIKQMGINDIYYKPGLDLVGIAGELLKKK